jgi:Uma2 family endonuclease
MYMATESKFWTMDELHRLPDDGNKYELVRGELFVTPPPSQEHETIAARLTRLLDPYVGAHNLGLIYRPRAVVRSNEGEVEPDLMVRVDRGQRGNGWENAPLPILIVEILSSTTRRRDLRQKREFYMDLRIPEYWIVDLDRRVVQVVRRGEPDVVCATSLVWHPQGTSMPLTIDLPALFASALNAKA